MIRHVATRHQSVTGLLAHPLRMTAAPSMQKAASDFAIVLAAWVFLGIRPPLIQEDFQAPRRDTRRNVLWLPPRARNGSGELSPGAMV
ncbi:MAG: hypothetical protein AUH81_16095 [Candidatus Rokubacteria bacterium 13_1_40CM_4_69_5]|nr:MAG: hypothetical protein AUH81_16095 [Candidatus Rokubacteria bacterium 13_1_40CM_4_69_5]